MRPCVCVAQCQEEVRQGGRGWVEAASGQTRGLELLQDIVWGPGWGPSQLLSSRVKSSSNLDLRSQTAPLTDLSTPSPLHSISLYKCSGYNSNPPVLTVDCSQFSFLHVWSNCFTFFFTVLPGPSALKRNPSTLAPALFQPQKTPLHGHLPVIENDYAFNTGSFISMTPWGRCTSNTRPIAHALISFQSAPTIIF